MSKATAVSGGKLPGPILFAMCSTYVLTIFLRVCVGAMAPEIEADMRISPTQVSLLASATMLGYGITQIPAGILTDIMGARKTLLLLLSIASLSTIIVGASGILSIAIAGRFITGMTIAVWAAMVVLLAAHTPPERFAQAIGLVIACGALGLILAGTPLALLSRAIGWQASLVFVGVIGFGIVLLVSLLVKPVPQSARPPRKPFSWGELGTTLLRVLRYKQFWALTIWQTAIAGTFFVFASAWWIKYLMASGQMSHLEAGNIFVMQAVIGAVITPLIATFSDRIGSRKKIIVAINILGILASLSLIFFSGKLGSFGMLVQALLFGVGTCGAGACLVTSIKETFPPDIVGTATGCANMLYPVYAGLVTPIFGLALAYKEEILRAMPGVSPEEVAAGSYGFACWVLVAGCVVAFITTFFIKETYGNHAQHVENS